MASKKVRINSRKEVKDLYNQNFIPLKKKLRKTSEDGKISNGLSLEEPVL
jgi:hypothetical protein